MPDTGVPHREEGQGAPLWEIRAAWLLRGLIVLTAGYHLARGDWLYAFLCGVALTLMVIPPLIARSSRLNIPLEIELLVLWWLVTDMTAGRVFALYDAGILYDKLIHFGNSGVFAIVSFLGIYTLEMTGKIRTGSLINVVGIFLVTLGIGALWEILEFASDALFAQGAQGAPSMSPLNDTMWDLIVDGAGGLIGGTLGAWYMKRSRRSLERWRQFVTVFSS